jgi:hypothetical protein
MLAFATHEYFQGLGFHYLHSPLITASDCEVCFMPGSLVDSERLGLSYVEEALILIVGMLGRLTRPYCAIRVL